MLLSLPLLRRPATAPEIPANTPPYVEITSPQDGANATNVALISFSCIALDDEDGELSGSSVVWTSDLDGQLGTGRTLVKALSVGSHTITCKVTDSGGLTATDSIGLTVTAYDPDPSEDPQPGQGPGVYDGPAELPRSVPTYTRSLDFTGNEHLITNASDLTKLLAGESVAGKTLQEGDCITLSGGVDYYGNSWVLNVSNVLIRGSNYALLPPPNTRVTDADRPYMPRLIFNLETGGNTPLLRINANVHNVRVIGVAFHHPIENQSPSRALSALVYVNKQWNFIEDNDTCTNIVFDAVHFHTSYRGGVIRLLSFNAMDSVIVDSHLYNNIWYGNDTQAIWAEKNAERNLVQNCFLVAAGENFMSGGAANPKQLGTESKDWTFRRCYFLKPPEWEEMGSYTGKNLWELKHGIRMLVEECVLEGWRHHGQQHCVNIKDSTADAYTKDVCFRWTEFADCDGFFSMSKQEGLGFGNVQIRQCRGWFDGQLTVRAQLISGDNVSIERSTFLTKGQKVQAFHQCGGADFSNFSLLNCVVGDRGPYGYFQGSGGREKAALDYTWPDSWTVQGNVMAGRNWYPSSSAAIAGNLRLEQEDCGFADAQGRLLPNSPIHGAGISGVTPGVDHDELDYRLRHVRSGDWNQ